MLYKSDAYDTLKRKTFKQFFRNHLLVATLLLSPEFDYLSSFTSVLIYPNGNKHFEESCKKYQELLNPQYSLSFISITFEEFISTCEKWCKEEKTTGWLNYLKNRYIITG